jgi:hypothetical protein
MFDDLRGNENKSSSPFFEEDQSSFEEEKPQGAPKAGTQRARGTRKGGGFQFIDSKGRILGMTAMQRFVISALLLAVVCIMGAMFMFVTGAFYL